MEQRELSGFLSSALKKYSCTGISVAVLHGEAGISCAVAGMKQHQGTEEVTVDTLFQIASLSKTVGTAYALPFLLTKGVRLDTPIKAVLESCESPYRLRANNPNDSAWIEQLQLKHLVNHTGLGQHYVQGYVRSKPIPSILDLIEGIKHKDRG